MLRSLSGTRGEFLVVRLPVGEYEVTVEDAGAMLTLPGQVAVGLGEVTEITARLRAAVAGQHQPKARIFLIGRLQPLIDRMRLVQDLMAEQLRAPLIEAFRAQGLAELVDEGGFHDVVIGWPGRSGAVYQGEGAHGASHRLELFAGEVNVTPTEQGYAT